MSCPSRAKYPGHVPLLNILQHYNCIDWFGREDFWPYIGVSTSMAMYYFNPVAAGQEIRIECETLKVGRIEGTSAWNVWEVVADASLLAVVKAEVRRVKDGARVCIAHHVLRAIELPKGAASKL